MPRGPLAWDNTADKQWRRSKQVQKGEERTLGERFLLVEYKLHISPSSGCRLDHWRNLPDITHPRQSPGWKDCSFLKHSYGCGYLLQRMILAFPFLSKKKKKHPCFLTYHPRPSVGSPTLAIPPYFPLPALQILLLLNHSLYFSYVLSLTPSVRMVFTIYLTHHLPCKAFPQSLLCRLKGTYLKRFYDNDQFLSCAMIIMHMSYFSY